MKKLILIIPALFLVGCSIQKETNCCETGKDQQCDEFYPYYNCPDPASGYWVRGYKQHIRSNTDYSGYYPQTQTVYYVPVETWMVPPVNNGPTLSNTPRPEQLGQYRERSPKPQNNNTRSTRE